MLTFYDTHCTRAKDAFVGYLQQHLSEFKSPKDVGPHLVHAIALAHIAIVHDKEDVFMAGTTTLVGGLLVKNDVSKSDSPTFTLMAISVGDCKVRKRLLVILIGFPFLRTVSSKTKTSQKRDNSTYVPPLFTVVHTPNK